MLKEVLDYISKVVCTPEVGVLKVIYTPGVEIWRGKYTPEQRY